MSKTREDIIKEQEILAPLWDYDVPDQIIGLLDERIEEYVQQRVIELLDKAIKEIRIMEDNHFQKAKFCEEHNFQMDQIKHQQIENELRRVCNIIQNTFDTGYVSTPEN